MKKEVANLLSSKFGDLTSEYVKLVQSVKREDEMMLVKEKILKFSDYADDFAKTSKIPIASVKEVKSELEKIFKSLKVERKEVGKKGELGFLEFKEDLIL